MKTNAYYLAEISWIEELLLEAQSFLIGIFFPWIIQTKSDKNAGFSHLNRFTPCQIAKKAIKLLPHLCQHLESTSGFFQASGYWAVGLI